MTCKLNCLFMLVALLVPQEAHAGEPFQIELIAKYSGNAYSLLPPESSAESSARGKLIVLDRLAVSDRKIELLGRKVRPKLLKDLPSDKNVMAFDSFGQFQKSLGEPDNLSFESNEMIIEDGNSSFESLKCWEVCCIQSDGTIRYLSVCLSISEVFKGYDLSNGIPKNLQPNETIIRNRWIKSAALEKPKRSTKESTSRSQLKDFIADNVRLAKHRERILTIIDKDD